MIELEKHLPEYAGEDEDAHDEENRKEDVVRVRYKHTLRTLPPRLPSQPPRIHTFLRLVFSRRVQ